MDKAIALGITYAQARPALWFGWDVTKIGPVADKAVYAIARTFAERVGKGEIQAKPEADEAKRKTLSL